ncbi:putative ribonucleoprotein [Ordospora colligata]|uniref:Putative ribonucleoprotein n=1 Tax=Ordospora colligata OC4 TaxID=1354746 RepID=A0A0B2UN82_9MICR|nr:putative ribonucleoprotein [Ordospora colligata OC4]KHN70420.1 putative ribonucleoprotein [Ordospora colligata OC4]TBU17170.1 putative ribonucleoprotein [Ordospora colligata]TBU17420.1 putative ribonucleoprotein [Ordospora colligata]TBU19600.1 putative ribonucleoprotein [Ordospora colligata]
MEILKFEPDTEGIKSRKNIQPFGDSSKIRVMKHTTAPAFALYTTEVDSSVKENDLGSVPYKPVIEAPTVSNAYIPPTMNRQEPCSVKISNLPLDMTRERLYRLIDANTNVSFMSPNLVMNKETGVFRGFAFVTVASKDDAMNLIKNLKGVSIDSLGLSAELAK